MSSKSNHEPLIHESKYYPDGFLPRGNGPQVSYALLSYDMMIHGELIPCYKFDTYRMTAWKTHDLHSNWMYKKKKYYGREEHDTYEFGGPEQAFTPYSTYILIGYCEDTEELLMLANDGKIYRLPEEYASSFHSMKEYF